MSSTVSRLVIAAAGLPVVLGAVYVGGWWLFALAVVAAGIGLHEFWLLAKPLRPLAPAGYLGGVLALVGAQTSGTGWMVGGAMTSLVLAFVLKGISATRQAPTSSISATVMAAVWIGFGLSFILLLRQLPVHGRLATVTVLLAVWAGRHLRVRRREAPGASSNGADDLAGQDLGGIRLRHGRDRLRGVRGPVQAALPHDLGVACARRRLSRSRRRSAISSSRC